MDAKDEKLGLPSLPSSTSSGVVTHPGDDGTTKDGIAATSAAYSDVHAGASYGYQMLPMPYPGSPYPVPAYPPYGPYQLPYGHHYMYEPKREKIKRPMNSFLLFSNEQRPILQAENPDKSNAEISKLLGQKWKSMPADKKSVYMDKAAKIKAKFHQAHPNFVYTKGPRKKKKRKSGQASAAESSPDTTGSPPSNLYYYSFAYQPYYPVPGAGAGDAPDAGVTTPASPAHAALHQPSTSVSLTSLPTGSVMGTIPTSPAVPSATSTAASMAASGASSSSAQMQPYMIYTHPAPYFYGPYTGSSSSATSTSRAGHTASGVPSHLPHLGVVKSDEDGIAESPTKHRRVELGDHEVDHHDKDKKDS